jgi:hypothetical protein
VQSELIPPYGEPINPIKLSGGVDQRKDIRRGGEKSEVRFYSTAFPADVSEIRNFGFEDLSLVIKL